MADVCGIMPGGPNCWEEASERTLNVSIFELPHLENCHRLYWLLCRPAFPDYSWWAFTKHFMDFDSPSTRLIHSKWSRTILRFRVTRRNWAPLTTMETHPKVTRPSLVNTRIFSFLLSHYECSRTFSWDVSCRKRIPTSFGLWKSRGSLPSSFRFFWYRCDHDANRPCQRYDGFPNRPH